MSVKTPIFDIEPDEKVLKEFSSYDTRGDKPAILTDKNIWYLDGILNKEKNIPYEDITAVILYEEVADRASINHPNKQITLNFYDMSGEEFTFRWNDDYLFDEDILNIREIKDMVIDQILNTERKPPIYKSDLNIEVMIPTIKQQVEEVLDKKGITDDGVFCLPSGAYKDIKGIFKGVGVEEYTNATSTKAGPFNKKYEGFFCSAGNLLLGRNTSEELVVIPHSDIKLFDCEGIVCGYKGFKENRLHIYTMGEDTTENYEFRNLDLGKLKKIITGLK